MRSMRRIQTHKNNTIAFRQDWNGMLIDDNLYLVRLVVPNWLGLLFPLFYDVISDDMICSDQVAYI